jgi:hypothetical protein
MMGLVISNDTSGTVNGGQFTQNMSDYQFFISMELINKANM